MTKEFQIQTNQVREAAEEIVKLLIDIEYKDNLFITKEGKRTRESLEDKIFQLILVRTGGDYL